MPVEAHHPEGRMPSFIIGGAAKSGTSTLHALLDRRPDVFIPSHELYLFSIDDYQQHPEFFHDPTGWVVRDYDGHRDEYLRWYRRFFAAAPPDAVIGEDSTTYLASARAAARIREVLPDVKLVFMLRDPASRTYSQYWHDLRVGRVVEGFEGTLRHAPGTLIQRSLYREQVQAYLDRFPRDRILFLLFEDLVRDARALLRQVEEFIGLAHSEEGASSVPVHRNAARVPRSIRLQLWRNRAFRDRAASRFRGHLPGTQAPQDLRERVVAGRWARLNLRRDRRPPPMQAATRRFLDAYFARENAGLSELIGHDVNSVWYRGGD